MNVMKANRDECVLCWLVVVVYSVEGGDRSVIFYFLERKRVHFFFISSPEF